MGETTTPLIDRIIGVCLIIYTFPFAFFRGGVFGGELTELFTNYNLECKSAILGTIGLRYSLRTSRSRNLLHVASLLALIYLLDVYIPKPLPVPTKGHESKTIVITGANSGVGYETARQLAVDYGMNVIIGCRSELKCQKATSTIMEEVSAAKSKGVVTFGIIDIADLDSVKTFVSSYLEGKQVDFLFNNAGYVPVEKVPVNKYGLDTAFSEMHLAHFYLTELLLKENPKMRVINTSSAAHNVCALDWMTPSTSAVKSHPGCLDEEYLRSGIRSETDDAAYMQAKMANMMHAVEIPHHHPQATAAAIELGWVGTSIAPFMTMKVSPESLLLMRGARVGVQPILHAILSSDDELMGPTNGKKGVMMTVFGQSAEAFTTHGWFKGDVSKERMDVLSDKLWQESVKILQELGYLDTDEE